jgi:O-antigen/teichoic acid export membrane protein
MKSEESDRGAGRRVLLNTFSNYGGQFVSITTWFLLTPFILHQLGDSHYGLWVLVASVVAYGTLLDFGISNAVTKYVAEFRATGEVDKARRLVSTALALYTAIGLLVVLASALLAPLFPEIFNVAPKDEETAIRLVFLAGIGVGVAIPASTTFAVLRGLQRFDLLNIIRSASTLFQALAIVLVLLAGGGVLGLAITTIVVRLLTQIPAVWTIHRTAPELRFGWRSADRHSVRTVASFSWAVFVLHFGGHLEAKTDEIVIGVYLPLASVASYSIVLKLSTLPQIITEQFTTLVLPISSELHAKDDLPKLRELLLTSTRITLAVLFPISISLMILGRPLLEVWVGDSYADQAPVLAILVLAVMLDAMLWPAAFLFQGMNRHKVPSLMGLGSGLANLALSIVLIQRWGLMGVALGTLIPTTLFAFGLVLPYAFRVVKLSWRMVGSRVFLPTLLPAIPLVLIIYYLRMLLDPDSYISLAFIAGLGALVYFALYLGWGAEELERKTFRGALATVHQTARKYARTRAP